MKSLSNFGLMRVGAKAMAALISSKCAFPSLVHENTMFFVSMVVRGFTMVAKLGINLLTKCILPRKLYRPFLWLGRERASISFVLSGLMVRPSLDTICPNNFPWLVAKTHLLGFKDIPYSLHLINTYLRWPKCSTISFEYIVISSR